MEKPVFVLIPGRSLPLSDIPVLVSGMGEGSTPITVGSAVDMIKSSVLSPPTTTPSYNGTDEVQGYFSSSAVSRVKEGFIIMEDQCNLPYNRDQNQFPMRGQVRQSHPDEVDYRVR
jgi:hypothetical protein